jgi:putative ABC transport system permease protein
MKIRFPRILRRLLALFSSDARDREMTEEMAFHIDAMARELVRSGMDEADARLEARRRFGSLLKQKEAGHEIRTGLFLEDVMRDARHMGRGLRRTPGFTSAVVLTLALGIGANTAIFSIVDQVLLRPLPYPQGEDLVMVYERQSRSENSVSPANWLDWQRDSRTLEGFAVWMSRSDILTGAGEAAQVRVQAVSHEFFPVLRVWPILGRAISEDDDRPNAQRTAVISHRLWQNRFGGDPKIIGRFIELDDRPHQVVGVMPAGFRFVYQDTDMWAAAQLDRARPWRETDGRFINVVGRLSTGTLLDAARVEMDRIGQRLASMHEFNRNTSVALVPLREVLTGTVETSLLILYLAVGVLLAIACFNIANLLIARAASRRQEIAVRTSLGAGRGAIVRQLLVESLMLALVGGALGIALARWGLDALLAVAPASLLGVPELRIDIRVLMYVAGLSVLTGLAAGLVPSFIVARRSIVSSLSANNSRVTHSPRIRQALVVAQVAMTVVLLCGAALLVRTVIALNNVSHGFEPEGLVTMRLQLSPTRYPAERSVAFFRDALDAIRELPGVESAAAGTSLPVVGGPRAGTRFHVRSTPVVPRSKMPSATIRVATPGYFRTMGIPVLRGREFTEADDANPAPGFVVNDAFVEGRLAGLDPLRESLMVRMQPENPYAPIIGVVGDVSERSVRGEARPTIYYSHRQLTDAGMTVFVRSNRPAAAAEGAVGVIRRLDANVPVTDIRTFEEALTERLTQERLSALVSGAFALSGLLLASLGLYALLAFLVTERTPEIGLRMALGAQGAELTWSVVKDGLRLVVIGAATGVALSLIALPKFGTLLFGVTPNDASTYALVLVLLGAVAGLASYAPARRAARVQPFTALRQE